MVFHSCIRTSPRSWKTTFYNSRVSFRRLFWDEQLKVNRLKCGKQMRWHPDDKVVPESEALIIVGILCTSYLRVCEVTLWKNPQRLYRVFKQKCKMLVGDTKFSELPEWKKHVESWLQGFIQDFLVEVIIIYKQQNHRIALWTAI